VLKTKAYIRLLTGCSKTELTWPRKSRKSYLKLQWTSENLESKSVCVNREDFNFIEKLPQTILQPVTCEHDNAYTNLLSEHDKAYTDPLSQIEVFQWHPVPQQKPVETCQWKLIELENESHVQLCEFIQKICLIVQSAQSIVVTHLHFYALSIQKYSKRFTVS
jgi:hypothetical protein